MHIHRLIRMCIYTHNQQLFSTVVDLALIWH